MKRSTLNSIIALVLVLLAVVLLIPIFSEIDSISQDIEQAECEHKTPKHEVKETKETYHLISIVCADCEKVLGETTEFHDYNTQSVCKTCGYSCAHVYSTQYTAKTDGVHTETRFCMRCGSRSVNEASHIYSNGICGACYHVCDHYGTGEYRDIDWFSRLADGSVVCVYCGDDAFNYCTVDGYVLEVWSDEQAYTWFAFDNEYVFTVDGEVVGNESGLVVCNPDGTPVNMRDWLEDGVAYVRKPLEHGELINYKDPSTCNHEDEEGNWSMVKCNKYDNLRRCMFCGHQAVG